LITFISPVMGSRNTHDYKIGEVAKMKDHLYKVARYTWMIGIPLIVGVCILGKNLSSWFLGAGYDKVPLLLSIMSLRFISSGFSELCSTQLLLPIGKEKYVTVISIIGAIVNIALNSFLIKDFGSVGAAIATMVTELLICVSYLVLVDAKGYMKVERILKMPFKYLISAAVMGLVLLAMNRMLSYSIFTFTFMFVIGVSVYFLSLAFLKDKFFLYLLSKTTNMLKRFKLRSKTK
ncbi:MAG: polysaccharide biosynthesis C-terminal domain-containing protein, partial [Candidatus Enterosoma sp.]|nr:polysaccharide biosynthesis C-terminal domain-containing protein [Candidatus Enterosoma sp.]